jgi:hypothetical protein
MTRHGTFVGAIAGLALLLAGAAARAQTCPPECPAPGEPIKPNKKQGCFVEFGGVPAADKGFKVTCKDGDSQCDALATADQCDFDLQVCINNADSRFPNCTPEGIASIDVKNSKATPVQEAQVNALRNAINNMVAGDPNLNVCTDAQTITVPLKVNKKGKRKKGVFKVNTKTVGLGGKKAKDKLHLTCLPADVPPPSCPLNPDGGPNRLALTVGAGGDLDTGWTGISHNQGVVEGFTVFLCLEDCDQSTNSVCTGIGKTDATGSGSINGKYFGPPLPLSTGGVPVCVVNEYRDDITLGKYDLATGEQQMTVLLTSRVHQGIKIDQPCPICKGSSVIGAGGTCDGGPGYAGNGRGCTVEGLTQFGNVSTKCLPDPANNIGNLTIDLPYTTESTLLAGDAFTCTPPPQGSGGPCPCGQQKQRNDCDSACSEAQCPSGLEPGVDQKCCVKSGQGRGCFEGDIPSQGARGMPTPAWPDPTYPKTVDNASVATTFCIPATESVIVNNVAGLSGPGHSILPGPASVALTRCEGGNNAGDPCGSDAPCDGGVCE